MNNSTALKALIIYAICLPLAMFLGYLISGPLSMSSLITMIGVAALLALPLIMRWHHALLLLSWHMSAVMFFLPGSPSFCMLMILISGMFFVLQRTLDRTATFTIVWPVALPLLALAAIVLATAKLTGGIGFRSMGSDVYGGKHYMSLLFGIAGFFVLSIRPIPLEKVGLYMSLFFLGGLTGVIGDFYTLTPSALQFIYWIFPPNLMVMMSGHFEMGTTRLSGTASVSTAIFLYMIAKYGLTGIFEKPLRTAIFLLGSSLGLLGGHRAFVITLGLIFFFQFFLEGLHRTKLLARFALLGVVFCIILVVFSSKLPFTLQRSLSFLPLEFERAAVDDGQSTMEWRYQMWSGVARQIPKYWLIGKGYAMSAEDFQASDTAAFRYNYLDVSQSALGLAGDYHNGWLSVIIPFGIGGVITFVWFLWATGRVSIRNYRYGNAELHRYNTLLLALFLEGVIVFIGGGLHSDIFNFASLVGISISLNYGVAQIQSIEKLEPRSFFGSSRLIQPRPVFQR